MTRFQRQWDALLTGVPFSIYKFSAGSYLWHTQGSGWGLVVMAWGVVDFVTNLLAASLSRPLPFCLLSAGGRLLQRENLALAIDTLLSALIVSLMLGCHCIADLGPLQPAWEVATICQILGVGLNRVRQAS